MIGLPVIEDFTPVPYDCVGLELEEFEELLEGVPLDGVDVGSECVELLSPVGSEVEELSVLLDGVGVVVSMFFEVS